MQHLPFYTSIWTFATSTFLPCNDFDGIADANLLQRATCIFSAIGCRVAGNTSGTESSAGGKSEMWDTHIVQFCVRE